MERNFETEVITRLTAIETKLDNYNKIEEKSEVAYTTSLRNRDDIKEMQENNKWIFRTAIGACIMSVIELIFILVKTGIGVG